MKEWCNISPTVVHSLVTRLTRLVVCLHIGSTEKQYRTKLKVPYVKPTCSTLMSNSPWIFLPLKIFTLNVKQGINLGLYTEINPLHISPPVIDSWHFLQHLPGFEKLLVAITGQYRCDVKSVKWADIRGTESSFPVTLYKFVAFCCCYLNCWQCIKPK